MNGGRLNQGGAPARAHISLSLSQEIKPFRLGQPLGAKRDKRKFVVQIFFIRFGLRVLGVF